MNKKTKKLIIVGTVLFLIVAAFIYLKYKSEAIISPSPIPKGELQLLNTSPPAGKSQTLFTSTGIFFTFDGPVILSSVNISVEPDIELLTDLANEDPNTLVIRPRYEWVTDTTYSLNIKSGLQSTDNKELRQDITYEIEFEIPEDVIHY